MMPILHAVNTEDQTITLRDGQVLPITNLFCCGVEFDRPYYDIDFEEATAMVCGPDGNGKWIAFEFNLSDFEPEVRH